MHQRAKPEWPLNDDQLQTPKLKSVSQKPGSFMKKLYGYFCPLVLKDYAVVCKKKIKKSPGSKDLTHNSELYKINDIDRKKYSLKYCLMQFLRECKDPLTS